MHYQRLWRNMTKLGIESTKTLGGRIDNKGLECKIRGCTEPARTKLVCKNHYKLFWRRAKKEGKTIDEVMYPRRKGRTVGQAEVRP